MIFRFESAYTITGSLSISSQAMERIKPCVYRSGCLNTMRSVRHISIAKSEFTGWPPGAVRCGADHTASASSLIQTVRSPRRRRLSSYSAQLVTRRFCFGILARRSALNLCGIYSILKKTDCSRYQWTGGPCNNAPWTGSQARRAPDNRARIHVRVQRCLDSVGIGWFCTDRGPWTKPRMPSHTTQVVV